MLRSLLFVIFTSALCSASALEDATVLRARLELAKVDELAKAGVLPHVRLEEAQETLADAVDDAEIRETLYARDISVDQADHMIELTERRVARKQKIADRRADWVASGIIAKTELADSVASLDQAKRESQWALDRSKLVRELADLAKIEMDAMRQMEQANAHSTSVEHFTGSNQFALSQFPGIEKAFEKQFHHELPVSAMGETEVHKALNFDHRNRVDVAVVPDTPDGVWLRGYLTSHKIPYYAFRGAVAGKATGAHIHIGPPSLRLLATKAPRAGAARAD